MAIGLTGNNPQLEIEVVLNTSKSQQNQQKFFTKLEQDATKHEQKQKQIYDKANAQEDVAEQKHQAKLRRMIEVENQKKLLAQQRYEANSLRSQNSWSARMSKGLSTLATSVKVFAAAYAAMFIRSAVSGALQFADDIRKQSEALDITIESLQVYNQMLGEAGSNTERTANIFNLLYTAIQDTDDKLKKSALAKFGIDVTTPVDEALQIIINSVRKGTADMSALIDIFGVKMTAKFNQIAVNVSKDFETIRRELGASLITEEQAKKVEEFNDALERVKVAIQVGFVRAMADVAGGVSGMLDRLKDAIANINWESVGQGVLALSKLLEIIGKVYAATFKFIGIAKGLSLIDFTKTIANVSKTIANMQGLVAAGAATFESFENGIRVLSKAGTPIKVAAEEVVALNEGLAAASKGFGTIFASLGKFGALLGRISLILTAVFSALDFLNALNKGLDPLTAALYTVSKLITDIADSLVYLVSFGTIDLGLSDALDEKIFGKAVVGIEKVRQETFALQTDFKLLTDRYLKLKEQVNLTNYEQKVYKETIDEIQSKYGNYLKNINLEKDNFKKVKTAIDEATTALKQHIEQMILAEVVKENTEELARLYKQLFDIDEAIVSQQNRLEELNKSWKDISTGADFSNDQSMGQRLKTSIESSILILKNSRPEIAKQYEEMFKKLIELSKGLTEDLFKDNKTGTPNFTGQLNAVEQLRNSYKQLKIDIELFKAAISKEQNPVLLVAFQTKLKELEEQLANFGKDTNSLEYLQNQFTIQEELIKQYETQIPQIEEIIKQQEAAGQSTAYWTAELEKQKKAVDDWNGVAKTLLELTKAQIKTNEDRLKVLNDEIPAIEKEIAAYKLLGKNTRELEEALRGYREERDKIVYGDSLEGQIKKQVEELQKVRDQIIEAYNLLVTKSEEFALLGGENLKLEIDALLAKIVELEEKARIGIRAEILTPENYLSDAIEEEKRKTKKLENLQIALQLAIDQGQTQEVIDNLKKQIEDALGETDFTDWYNKWQEVVARTAEFVGEAFNAMSNYFNNIAQGYQMELEYIRELMTLENERWAEQDARMEESGIKNTAYYLLLKKQHDAYIKDQAAKEKGLEAQITAEKAKGWEWDRAGKITQTIMNTAQAIMATYAAQPLLAYLLVPIISAIGALQVGTIAAQQNPYKRNSGGWIPGFGPDRDTVPAMLTPGEYVVNRDAARENASLLEAINNGNRVAPAISNSVYVNIDGNLVGNSDWVENDLIPEINKAINKGYSLGRN